MVIADKPGLAGWPKGRRPRIGPHCAPAPGLAWLAPGQLAGSVTWNAWFGVMGRCWALSAALIREEFLFFKSKRIKIALFRHVFRDVGFTLI